MVRQQLLLQKNLFFNSSDVRLKKMLEEKYYFPRVLAGLRMKSVFPEPYTMAAMSESGNPYNLAYGLAEAIAELGKGIHGTGPATADGAHT
jgi:hypothetical protein